MESVITVVLADDHAMVRQGFKFILEQCPRIRVVGEAANGRQALDLVLSHQPTVLVTDIVMPLMSGFELADRVRELKLSTRTLLLTMCEDNDSILRAVRTVVAGFVSKSAVGDELVEAVLQVAHGGEYFEKSIYLKAFEAIRTLASEEPARISPREHEVLQLLANGLSTKLIADKLSLSGHTVSNHRISLLRKFSVHNVAGLIRKASELNFIK